MSDVLLLALPVSVLISLPTPWWTKVRLCILCTLGLLMIVVVIIRLPINMLNSTVQANRTLWASTELLAAAIVVNTPILYGAFNRWRQQKPYLSSSLPGGFTKPRSAGNANRSKHSQTSIYPTVNRTNDEIPLCIHCLTTVTSESTHYLNCEGQEGIIMTTIEASSYDEEGFKTAVEASLCERDSLDISEQQRR